MKTKITNMLKGKERNNWYGKLNRGRWRRFIYKINCKGKRTVGKANKEITVGKNVIGLKKLKLQKRQKKKKWKKREKRKEKKKQKRGKLHRTAKAQHEDRGL